MASGDTLWEFFPLSGLAPATLPAGLKFIADASTPVASIPVLTFADGTEAWMYWTFDMPSYYAGGGFTLSWKGGTDNTSVGTLQLDARLLTIPDATILTGDLTFDSATAANMIDTPPAPATNKLNYSTTYTLTHANAGSPAVGNAMGFSVTRNYTTDTNTGNLQCASILLLET